MQFVDVALGTTVAEEANALADIFARERMDRTADMNTELSRIGASTRARLSIMSVLVDDNIMFDKHTLFDVLVEAAEKNPNYAKQVKIIYGGNLTPENSDVLFSMENIDGGLVGRCSIDPKSFIKLCHVADQLNCGERE
jgi:hypothetical protein